MMQLNVNNWCRVLGDPSGEIYREGSCLNCGLSVRCLKDSEAPVLQGCTDVGACNFLVNATQDDGSCLYPNATCDDGDVNTVNDVINGECVCVGTFNVAVGQDYQGGKLAYVFQPGDLGYVEGEYHGIIAASNDLPGTYSWGCANSSVIPGADGTAIGTGRQNTIDMMSAVCGEASQVCSNLELNGFDDWFLPSRDELQQLRNNMNLIGGFQTQGINTGYWTSSEFDALSAWRLSFANFEIYGQKPHYYNVRPIRYF
jgi:hypothetical protein